MIDQVTESDVYRIQLTGLASWIEKRRETIGASESPSILGVGYSNSGPLSVWDSKVNPTLEDKRIELLELGIILEPAIRRAASQLRGLDVVHPQPYEIWYNRKLPWMHATPDGCVKENGEIGGFEAKNVGAWFRDEWSEGIPLRVNVQAQHQMAVCNFPFVYVAGLVGGNHLECHRIDRDEDFIDSLCDHLKDFYRYIETRKRPKVDELAVTSDVLFRLHPDDNGQTVDIDHDDEFNELESIQQEIKRLQKRERLLKNTVKASLGDNTYGRLKSGRAFSWSTTEKKPYEVKASKFRTLRLHKSLPKKAR